MLGGGQGFFLGRGGGTFGYLRGSGSRGNFLSPRPLSPLQGLQGMESYAPEASSYKPYIKSQNSVHNINNLDICKITFEI